MKLITTLFLTLFISFQINAQVSISEDGAVRQLFDRYVANNKSSELVTGYRIQLIATTDRMKMEAEMERFVETYPQMSVDWIHSKPYYKLRVGAYATKLEAFPALYTIKKDFPGAYLAKDNAINVKELAYQ